MEQGHPQARRAVGAAATLALAVAGGIALLLFFVARDDAPVQEGAATGGTAARGPGEQLPDQGARHLRADQRPRVRYASDPPASGPHVPEGIHRDEALLTDDQIIHALERGNVVVAYGSPTPPAGLRRAAREVGGGPFDPALVRAGQAVVLARRPGTRGLVALAWRHRLPLASAADPRLARFVDFWLGQGAPR